MYDSNPQHQRYNTTMIKINLRDQLTQVIIILVIVVGMLGYMFTRIQNLRANAGSIEAFNTGQNLGKDVQAAEISPSDDDHLRGSKDAEIIIYEFSDFECPFCQKHHETLSDLVENNNGKVAWSFKHFPLSSHPFAQEKAEASECVAELGGSDAFWAFADELFEQGTAVPVSQLASIAETAGVKKEDFETCFKSGKHAATVAAQQQLGTASGVSGTPGNIILHVKTGKQQLVSGALPEEQLQGLIDSMLE